MKKSLKNKISELTFTHPSVKRGESLFKGTRIPVSFVLDQLALGWSIKEINQRHPELEQEALVKVITLISGEFSHGSHDKKKTKNTWTYRHRWRSTSTI